MPEVAFDQLEGGVEMVFALIGDDVVEGFGFVVSRFHLDRGRFSVIFNDEINLIAIVEIMLRGTRFGENARDGVLK